MLALWIILSTVSIRTGAVTGAENGLASITSPPAAAASAVDSPPATLPDQVRRTESPAPELIFVNGKIATVDERFQVAEAIALTGERILRVGSSREILALRGSGTRVVDLRGKLVIPGLIDSHVHPGAASMFEFDHTVPDMNSIAEVLEYVGSRTRTVPEGQWIWVQQVFVTRLEEQRFPTREELDAAAPRHPVVFSTGPDAMANSLALSLSGLTRDFEVQGSGSIERDPATGELTGMLRGGTKRYLKYQPQAEKVTEEQRQERLAMLLRDYNSVGITSIADRDASAADIDRYEALRRAGRLPVRVAASHSVNAADPIESVREKIREVADHPLRNNGTYDLRVVGIKSYLDGGMLTGSALMRRPWGVSRIYRIDDPDYLGVRFIPADKLRDIVRCTTEAGLQFTAHSVGDGAVHALLEAYAEVNADLPIRATRPCITHCNFMSAEAIAKMAQLGVVADIQPVWLYLDGATLQKQFGNDRLEYFQPLRSLMTGGVVVGGGSDHMQKVGARRAINPYDPFLGLSTTITRKARRLETPLHSEQSLSRAQALAFYTRNNAFLTFRETVIGSLEAGKLADLVVLDRDILACPVDEIRESKVLTTLLGGKVVAGSLPD